MFGSCLHRVQTALLLSTTSSDEFECFEKFLSLDINMLPSFTAFPVSQTVSSSNTGFDGVSITAGSLGGLNHGPQGPPPDPNSSEGFKQNIRNAQTLVLHLQEMARKVLNDMYEFVRLFLSQG